MCRRRASGLRLAAPLGAALVVLLGAESTAAGPTVEAGGGAGGFFWSPARTATGVGGAVTFASPSPSVPHGVTWTGGPGTPACTGVPIDEGKSGWSGECTFAQAGTYSFRCTIHPVEMQGTVSVGEGGPPPSPGQGSPPVAPVASGGPAAAGLRLPRRQRGRAVRGSVVPRGGVGGRLEVQLFGARALLAGKRRAGRVRVGQLARRLPASGRVRFSVSLKRLARRALRGRRALRLTAIVTVTAGERDAFERRRTVVMRDRRSRGRGAR